MSDSWPVNVCLHMPSRTSQSLAEASQAPETNNRVSGANDRLMTSPVCPANVVVCWPVSMSQSALQIRIHNQDNRLFHFLQCSYSNPFTYQVVSPELVTIWLSSTKRQQDRYPDIQRINRSHSYVMYIIRSTTTNRPSGSCTCMSSKLAAHTYISLTGFQVVNGADVV